MVVHEVSEPIDWAAAGNAATDSVGVVPDHTKSRENSSPKAKFEEFAAKTKLGANKAPRSPVRKLTEADREKIEGVYAALALAFVVPSPLFNEDAANAIAGQATPCADAWFNLAENNDSVRRMLLMFIEGGAWGALIAAHVPIVMAFMPEHTKRAMSAMFARPEVPDSPEGL
jgi:hypothetical protein